MCEEEQKEKQPLMLEPSKEKEERNQMNPILPSLSSSSSSSSSSLSFSPTILSSSSLPLSSSPGTASAYYHQKAMDRPKLYPIRILSSPPPSPLPSSHTSSSSSSFSSFCSSIRRCSLYRISAYIRIYIYRFLTLLLTYIPLITTCSLRILGPILVIFAWGIFYVVYLFYFAHVLPILNYTPWTYPGNIITAIGWVLLFHVYYFHIMATLVSAGSPPNNLVRIYENYIQIYRETERERVRENEKERQRELKYKQ